MDKRNWLWKRKSSEKSPGGTESSGSISSHSERYSDDQEAYKASPNDNTQSPEVTSKASVTSEEVNDSIKILTEKLSAALVNVSAKEDLVKQHSRVAEEAVAGWEKAENEVAVLKQQLEAAVQQNLLLEDRASHLDGALKECVRQLRQAKDHQEQKISEAILEKSREWDATKIELENQILLLQTEAEDAKADSRIIDPNIQMKMDSLERENADLKLELLSRSEELEIRIIERDLSAQAAESASKQHLESIKKVAKLEAECRRLQAVARKSSSSYDQKSVSASSHYVDSLTDSQSDSGERLSALDIDSHKMSEKAVRKSIAGPLEIDMMDDFLEMERLAALADKDVITTHQSEEADSEKQCVEEENPLKAELEEMTHRMEDLEEKLQNIEVEKSELQKALIATQDSLNASQDQLKEAEARIEELQKELNTVNESKELLEFQLIGMDVEARTMAAQVVTLKEEVEKEKGLSAEMTVKCQELEDELRRKSQEIELQQISASKAKPQVKQEDLDVAAGKLAECQKTIASLGRQLQSLATLEDFLIDTANLPGFSGGGLLIPGGGGGELWKLHSNETFKTKNGSDPPQLPVENGGPLVNGTDKESSTSSSSSSSTSSNHVGSSRRRNGLEKLFSRSKSGKLENQQA